MGSQYYIPKKVSGSCIPGQRELSAEIKPKPPHNHLLAALSPEVQGRLFPHLELVRLPYRAIMYEVGQPIEHVYFPTNAIITLQHLLEDGKSTAILMMGNDGLLGSSLDMNPETMPVRLLVQSAGHAYRLPKARVEEEFRRHEEFLALTLRYTQVVMTQISQNAVCNRHHSIDQQFCRWLLLSMDRTGGDHLMMTQEFICNMLGVRRESVTQAATRLYHQGVIAYARGRIDVLARPALEAACCECYEVVKKEADRLLGDVPH